MKRRENWKAGEIEYMSFLYGGNVAKYEREMKEDKRRDDRQVYVNTYNMIMEMLGTMPDEPHLYAKVAIADKMREDIEMMKRINLRFTGKEFSII